SEPPLGRGSRLARMRLFATLALAREELDDEQDDADDDEAVGEVEAGPGVAAPQAEVQEVDALAVAHAIDQVADRAPEDQAEGERGESVPGGELSIEGEDQTEREKAPAHEEEEPPRLGAVRQHAECGAGIAHVGDVEEAFDHGD